MIREKKHRLPRDAYRGHVLVAFTACVADSRHLFTFNNAQVVAEFVSHLKRSAAATRCEVPAYCFMPDHAHVLIQGVDDLSDAWQAMKGFKQHIVNNPVRARLVARWDEYPYSGAFPHDLRDILASASA